MEELLQRKPGRMILYGNSICLAITAVVLAVLYALSYPMELRQPVSIERGGVGAPYCAVMRVGQPVLSRVNVGQEVRITLVAYPEEKFGWLTGRISGMDDKVSPDGSVHVFVTLADNRIATLRQGLTGEAVLAVEQRRMLWMLLGRR